MHPTRRLLAVWLALVSTGVTFAHSHAGGSAPHSHGYGVGLTPAPSHAPSCRHSHVLLLGLELDCPESDAAEGGSDCQVRSLVDPAPGDAPVIDYDFAAPTSPLPPVVPIPDTPAPVAPHFVPIPSPTRLAVLRL